MLVEEKTGPEKKKKKRKDRTRKKEEKTGASKDRGQL